MPRADEETGLPRKRKRCGTPRILSDTEEHFTFTIPRSGLADNEAIRFAKDGNESWIETVKWAQRNGKKICVRYDEHDVSAAWIDEEVFLLYPPTDLHELP